jgi:hypothetical protein
LLRTPPERNSFMTAPVIDLSFLAPAQGFIIQGDAANDRAGSSVSNAGDVNGDGIDDLIIGARYSGAAYVVYGRADSTRGTVDLTNLSATRGFEIQGGNSSFRVGSSVSSAGDVNGDGVDDLIVGAPAGYYGGYRAGEAYVIYGQ